jgi:hypothetical protein
MRLHSEARRGRGGVQMDAHGMRLPRSRTLAIKASSVIMAILS